MSTESAHSHLEARRYAVLAIVLISYLIIILDTSIVITGLPQIQASLGFSHAGLSWVQSTYTLSFGGLMMLGARAGDLFGRKRVFQAGIILFTLASLVIGLAQSPFWMLLARATQGVGAAIIAPSTLTLLSTYFPEGHERTRALAFYAATAGLGASLGLVAGGIFAGFFSWRLGFFVNIPIGLALLFAARKLLDESEIQNGRFDLFGAISSTLGMTSLVFGIERSAELGWQQPQVVGSMAAGLLLLAIFIRHQAHTEHPMLPLRLFASRERVGAYLARMLFVGAMFSFFFFSTQFMQGVLRFFPMAAGMAYLAFSIPSFVASTIVPGLTRRFGNTRVLLFSLIGMAVGMSWLSQSDQHSSYVTGLALPMILLGLGNGAGLGPLTVAGVTGVARDDAGAASGLVNVAHQLGGTLGLSILVVIFSAAAPPGLNGQALFAHQISAGLEGCAAFLALAVLVIFMLNIWPNLKTSMNDRVLVAEPIDIGQPSDMQAPNA